jgi:hypothetical protein
MGKRMEEDVELPELPDSLPPLNLLLADVTLVYTCS